MIDECLLFCEVYTGDVLYVSKSEKLAKENEYSWTLFVDQTDIEIWNVEGVTYRLRRLPTRSLIYDFFCWFLFLGDYLYIGIKNKKEVF